jgi:uncharacterized DUF497 family protein
MITFTQFEWDEVKSFGYKAKHGVAFALVEQLDWKRATIRKDERRDYAEPRYIAYIYLKSRLHICVFTTRGQTRRIISLRKANQREVKYYEKSKKA